jgi:PAS domain S-box-containing protein
VRPDPQLLEESAEELFEDAPCGYLTTLPDGMILRVNRTFETWTGRRRENLIEQLRFQDLLSPGGRIYHETHYAPLLRMQGSVRTIAVDIVRRDGSLLPALVNSTLREGDEEAGRPALVRTTVIDATDRRRYEQELLRLREQARETALQLQRSLLAGALPRVAGAELGFFYSPGVRGTKAGGDWYDAFWLEEDASLALAVGDVVGHGIAAAAAMGQLRSALRALAGVGLAPGGLLAGLDAFSSRHGIGAMTTIAHAQLDVRSRRLRFACAGHPPPLVVEQDGSARFLWEGRSLPLGLEDSTRAEGTATLAPGALLVLYTDGLIERRDRPHEDGMARLREHVCSRRALPVESLLPAVASELRDQEKADDLCLLGVRMR